MLQQLVEWRGGERVAYICPNCGRVHPRGAVTCDRAKAQIETDTAEFRHDVRHHQETCEGCPNPQQHVLDLHQLKKQKATPRLLHFGARAG